MKNTIWRLLSALALLAVTGISAGAQSIYTPYAFTNVAGVPGGVGTADGLGIGARFNTPADVAVDGAGNLYVADEFNCTIRKMTPAGTNWVVSTLAGSPRLVGFADGTNSGGTFGTPSGVAVDSSGNVFVADQSNNTIRRVTPDGVVTTLAGTAPLSGSKDGSNSVARFNRPYGLAVDGTGNIYVSDSGNYTIRKITQIGTNWAVTTIAGTAGQFGNYDGTNGTVQFGGFVNGPRSIAVDSAGNLIVADVGNSTIRKLTAVGTNWIASTLAGNGSLGTQDGTNSGAQFYNPYGVALDNAGNIFVTDGDYLIRKMTLQGTNWVVKTVAGNTAPFQNVDGTGTAAGFFAPEGLRVDAAGNVYVADANNSTIRMMTPATVVTTIAGAPTHYGTNDGVGSAARFYGPFGVTTDSATNIYVSDQSANLIRKVTPDGTVTTLIGDGDSAGGNFDSTNRLATFRQPSCIAVDGAGNIYVADAGNYRIRKVTPIGTNWVSSPLAGGGGPGGPGFRDGTNKVAQFAICYGLCIDAATNIYVADTGNDLIRRVSLVGTTNWVVTTVAGQTGQAGYADGTNKNAQFNSPWGIAVDSATNLYVADYGNMSIRKIRPSGTNWIVTTIAGSNGFFGSVDGTNNNARFLYPQGIAIDPAGNLYVSDGGNSAIRRVSPAGTNWVVTTLGGQPRPGEAGEAGAADGIGSAAHFSSPAGLAVGPDGNLYIPDVAENRLVRGTPLFLFDTAATSFTTADGSFHFRVIGPPGSNAVVQLSTDLQNWTGAQTNRIPPIGLTTALPGTNAAGFYRALLTP
jgi:sugar lactone lactonase YvrE